MNISLRILIISLVCASCLNISEGPGHAQIYGSPAGEADEQPCIKSKELGGRKIVVEYAAFPAGGSRSRHALRFTFYVREKVISQLWAASPRIVSEPTEDDVSITAIPDGFFVVVRAKFPSGEHADIQYIATEAFESFMSGPAWQD